MKNIFLLFYAFLYLSLLNVMGLFPYVFTPTVHIVVAANLTAGHLLFAIISGFAFNMLSNGLIVLSTFPLLVMIFITLLEMAVAIIQAYVFCLLTAIYLGDTVALH